MNKLNHDLHANRYSTFINLAVAKGAKIKKATEDDFIKLYNAENNKFKWLGRTFEEELIKTKNNLKTATEIFISNASSLQEKRLFKIMLIDIEEAKTSEQIYFAVEGGFDIIEFVKGNNNILFN